jgi:hypothetical protein
LLDVEPSSKWLSLGAALLLDMIRKLAAAAATAEGGGGGGPGEEELCSALRRLQGVVVQLEGAREAADQEGEALPASQGLALSVWRRLLARLQVIDPLHQRRYLWMLREEEIS